MSASQFPLIISFHTPDRIYVEHAENLRRGCEQFRLQSHIVEVESRGDWIANCGIKGGFVVDCLHRFQRSVLWIDCDAEIVRHPALFDTPDFEFAAHVSQHLLSGTLYFSFSKRSINLAERWAAECKRNTDEWDQRSLAKAYVDSTDPPSFKKLPQGYCKIFDKPWYEEDRIEYIVHHQASRQVRRNVNVKKRKRLD